ncbi:MAG: hypothetical protein LBF77_05285 [Spirochaetaceae bacterium]|jgi:hypothetical protein|nr:hypothetical protein [Spirochaetaceae bacterium]
MKILEVKDVVRKDVPIYYRRFYTGIAVMELINKTIETRIDFSIEIKPTGHKEILINLLDKVDYPLVPLNKELKKMLDSMDSAGEIPV